jgi:alkylation response protein AidB-like acyl-CoA dehydrogenase
MVAWQAAGTGRGAFEHAMAYTTRGEQFGQAYRTLPARPRSPAPMLANVPSRCRLQ